MSNDGDTATKKRRSVQSTTHVDPVLEEESGPTTVLVRLQELGDEDITPEQLKEHANKTQNPVIQQLETMDSVTIENGFWITNAIAITADLDHTQVETVAAIDDVTAVHTNVELTFHSDKSSSSETPKQGSTTDADTDSAEASWNVERVNAPEAWATYGTKGDGACVAVLDTGIEVEHDDLDLYTTDPDDETYPGGWAEMDSYGNVIDNPEPPYDDHGHGTRVSGAVNAGDASGEYLGVAPDSKFMHGKIAGEDGYSTFTQMAGGLEWAVDHGADVVSISFGADGYYSSLIDPIRNAENSGTVVVAAIGNNGPDTSTTPGNEYDSIGVGASDYWDDISSFSSGEEIDTDDAWGSDAPDDWPDKYVVPSVVAPGSAVLTTDLNNDYSGSSGTSIAAPHVAGGISLMFATADADHHPDDVKDALRESAYHPDGEDAHDTRYGHGILDVKAAIEYLDQQETAEFDVSDASLVEETILAGETAAVTATIENVGESEGEFTAEFNLTDSDGETTTRDTETVELDVDESTTITLENVVDEAGTYDADVSEEPAGTLSVEQPARFELSGGALSDDEIEEGESVVVSAQVANTGDREGTFTAELYVDDTHEQTTDVSVGSNDSESVSFTYEPTETGEYEFEVVGDDNDGGETTTFAGTLAVLEPAEFDLQNPAISDTTILEGEEITASVTVENTGEVEETFTAELEVTADGTTEIRDTTDVTLDGGETTDVSFDEQFDDPGEYDVAISGAHAGTLVVEEAVAEFVTDDVTLSEATILEGDSVEVTATVENVGDATGDHEATLYVDTEARESETVTLEPDESTTVAFEETLEDAGTYEITVDDGNSATLTVEQPASFTVTDSALDESEIEEGESVEVTATVENTGDRDGELEVTLSVDGATVDSATKTIPGDGSDTYTFVHSFDEAGEYELDIDGDEIEMTTVGTVSVQAPDPAEFEVRDAWLSDDTILEDEPIEIGATVENVGGEDGTFWAELKIDSELARTEEITVASGETETVLFDHTFEEAGEYDVAVSDEFAGVLTVEQPATFTIVDTWMDSDVIETGESVVTLAEISNEGDREGTFDAELIVEWKGVVATAEVEIAAGETETVSLEYTFEDAGAYDIYVNQTFVGELIVEEPPEFDVDVVLPEEPVDTDESVAIDVTVENVGGSTGTKTIEVTIDDEDPETDEVELDADEAETLTFYQTFEEPGEYVVAVNGSEYGTIDVVEASGDLLEHQWTYENGARVQHSAPAVAGELVFVGGLGEPITALSRDDGNVVWEFTRDGSLSDSSPAVHDGIVYVGSGGGGLYALDAETGERAWKHQTESAIVSSPAIADGTVYVGTNDGRLLALDTGGGDLEWTKSVDSAIYSTPAVDDGVVYVTTAEGTLVVVDSATGTYYWSFDIGAASQKASPIVADGTVYVAGDAVYAFDASNKKSKQWEQSIGGTILSTPAVDNGTVYLGSEDETIYALDATDGSVVWDKQTDEAVVGRPAVADGNVVVGTLNGTVLLLDGETGEVYEEKALGEAVYAPPAVADDEVYLGTHDGQYVVLANVS